MRTIKLTIDERLDTVIDAAVEMRRPTVYGQSIIILVYLPILSFTGVEGKMFHPMAMTVIIALLSEFLLSLTFFPAMIALFVSGHGEEHENALVMRLKQIYDPPVALYVRGEAAVLTQPGIAVVGTRHPTPYGMGMAERLACDLANAGLVIISGMARGIDTAAHEGALAARGRTVAVLGSGLDRLYLAIED